MQTDKITHARDRVLLILAVLGMVLLLSGCRAPWKGRGSAPRQSSTTPAPVRPGVPCPMDGVPVLQQDLRRRPLAVMVENSPDARPQSGLTQACVVYEAITEGGITRFLAVYLHGNPAVIGPVRSARPHFINVMREFDAAYVHCGESNEALRMLRQDPSIYNIDQMRYAKPFWRDHSRRAPHNLYTSSKKIRQLLGKYRWDSAASALPVFTGTQQLISGPAATKLDIHFPGAVHYKLVLTYNAKMGGYLRYMDGKLHIDRETKQPIVAKNVLIQRVHAMPYEESNKGTVDVQMIGSGEGLFLSNGRQQSMHWIKSNAHAMTMFTDIRNNPLPFNPGQTWVEIVPLDGKVTMLDAQPQRKS